MGRNGGNSDLGHSDLINGESESMEGVFSYFVAIGAGLTTGVVVVLLPSVWLYKKMMNRKGAKNNGAIRG